MCPEAWLGGQTLPSLPCQSEHELADSRTPGCTRLTAPRTGGRASPPVPSPWQWTHQEAFSAEQALLTGLWVQGGKKKQALSGSSFRFRVNWSGWSLGIPSELKTAPLGLLRWG